MIERDTVRLLRECDAGVQMGISAIDNVLDSVRDDEMKQSLCRYKAEHEKLEQEIRMALDRFHDRGKAPDPMAKGMSWLKTNMRLAVNTADTTVADLMTDGCNMGVKSLNKYLNQYPAADEDSKHIAKKLIRLEENLAEELRGSL